MQIERNSIYSIFKLFYKSNRTLTVLYILIHQNLLPLPVWKLNLKRPVI